MQYTDEDYSRDRGSLHDATLDGPAPRGRRRARARARVQHVLDRANCWFRLSRSAVRARGRDESNDIIDLSAREGRGC